MTKKYDITPLDLKSMQVFKGLIHTSLQSEIVSDLRDVVREAPVFSPMTPYGKPMSVRMTSAGRFGWVSDRHGYRYSETHPDGAPWPLIPERILNIWDTVAPLARKPECCLVNFYGEDAKMGMHQDRDESDFEQPVVSISLGDEALFRVGNATRGGKTESIWLQSGDVVVMSGAARLLYHGIDRVKYGSSQLLPKSGRINLTMRVVT
ncbi:alkylated DNA repair protein (DNA oxidative demethylase) [Celeribacter marinus]|uniref:Alkylated DNA repair protein AlkB n=2 Tax=Celeribacter marinus TaxID=1397108 RepID=A0A0N9ZZI4_9RHOB|nr:alpha-ketoglutarate-dependent dioxygenase AlkB [Celeribacter marinus]ALI55769.1 alkylated DNA repair protein AlkB [Celeribacter marinus]SFK91810.1 alkylated DNA repair protein (DNA oxidative demethylase) [Celeribacter marinus]